MTVTSTLFRHYLKICFLVMFPDTGNTDKQAVIIGSVTAAGGVAVLAIIGLVVLFIKYRIARLIMNRNKVGDLYTTQDEQMRRQNVEKDETL